MHRWKTTALVKATDPDITSVFMPCDLNQLVQLMVPTASLWPGFCPAPAEGYRKGSEGIIEALPGSWRGKRAAPGSTEPNAPILKEFLCSGG